MLDVACGGGATLVTGEPGPGVSERPGYRTLDAIIMIINM